MINAAGWRHFVINQGKINEQEENGNRSVFYVAGDSFTWNDNFTDSGHTF